MIFTKKFLTVFFYKENGDAELTAPPPFLFSFIRKPYGRADLSVVIKLEEYGKTALCENYLVSGCECCKELHVLCTEFIS